MSEGYKQYLDEILKSVYHHFKEHLGALGDIYIAGGACRDTLCGREPKDYDIFILNPKNNADQIIKVWHAEQKRNNKVEDTRIVGLKSEGSTNKSCAQFRWNGLEIQIIIKPYKTVEELLAKFDTNVCMFAYGVVSHTIKKSWFGIVPPEKEDYINLSGLDISSIEKKLALLTVNYIDPEHPFYNLGRLFYLREKLHLDVEESELYKIIDIIGRKRYGDKAVDAGIKIEKQRKADLSYGS
jgi:hypothetical protein